MRTLLLGYGNPLRSDDGVALRIAAILEQEAPSDVEVRTTQQLHLELIEDFVRFDRIVLIDAGATGPEIRLERIQPSASRLGSSHHLDPALLLALAGPLGTPVPELFLCTVRGEAFDFGESLTPQAARRAEETAGILRRMLEEDRPDA